MSREGQHKRSFDELRCPFLSQSKNVPVYCTGQKCDYGLWMVVQLPLEYRVRCGKSVVSGCGLRAIFELWKIEHW